MKEVLPAILQKNKIDCRKAIWFLGNHRIYAVHLDVMDGKFVDNFSFGPPDFVERLAMTKFEVHLMVEKPLSVLSEYKLRNVIRAIPHWEALSESDRRNMPDRFSIAINPKTPVSVLNEYLERLDHVLFMGVQPGWSGQSFDYSILPKIEEFCKIKKPETTVGADGGVDGETAPLLVKAGVGIINAASFIFKDIPKNYALLAGL
jgi:ribulose-phosphate 3-epimerase